MGATMRILAIGLCAIPLAAGHADAFQGRPSPHGQSAPRGRDGQPPPQQAAPQGQPPPNAQPSPQGGHVAGQLSAPGGGPGAGRAPGRNSAQNGSGGQDRPENGRRDFGEQGQQQTSSSPTQSEGSSGHASVAGSPSDTRRDSRHDAGNGGAEKQTASTGSSRHGSGKSKSTPSTGGSQGASSKSSSSSSSSAASTSSAAPSSSASPSPSATPAVAAPAVSPPAAAAPNKTSATKAGGSSRRAGAHGHRAAHRSASAHARSGVAGVAVTQGAALAAFKQPSPHTARTTPAKPAVKKSSNPLAKLGGQIPLPIPVPDWSKPIIIALLLLAAWFGVRSRLAAVRARRLERQRAVLLRDVGAMQAALVPEVPALLGGLAVSVAYRPAEGPAAGGDFYDLFAPEPGKVAMMLGDVAGHGHSALTHAALTRYTLRAYLQAGLEPRAALALAGRVLADPLGERYATVAVGVFDTAAGTLTYSLAGHPPPILNGMQAREPVTRCSSPPVGWGAPTGRRQTTISLPAGAAACFFSDGLIEARSGGELLGRERLREIVAGLGSEPEASDLLENVRAAAEGAPDDMVACVLSPEPTAAGAGTHVEELEADSKALCKDEVPRFLEECLLPASEVATVIEQARVIADSYGSALLRVELPAGSTTATATASAPGPGTRHAESPGAAGDASEPLFEALLAG